MLIDGTFLILPLFLRQILIASLATFPWLLFAGDYNAPFQVVLNCSPIFVVIGDISLSAPKAQVDTASSRLQSVPGKSREHAQRQIQHRREVRFR
jgi:hypothetical protein